MSKQEEEDGSSTSFWNLSLYFLSLSVFVQRTPSHTRNQSTSHCVINVCCGGWIFSLSVCSLFRLYLFIIIAFHYIEIVYLSVTLFRWKNKYTHVLLSTCSSRGYRRRHFVTCTWLFTSTFWFRLFASNKQEKQLEKHELSAVWQQTRILYFLLPCRKLVCVQRAERRRKNWFSFIKSIFFGSRRGKNCCGFLCLYLVTFFQVSLTKKKSVPMQWDCLQVTETF